MKLVSLTSRRNAWWKRTLLYWILSLEKSELEKNKQDILHSSFWITNLAASGSVRMPVSTLHRSNRERTAPLYTQGVPDVWFLLLFWTLTPSIVRRVWNLRVTVFFNLQFQKWYSYRQARGSWSGGLWVRVLRCSRAVCRCSWDPLPPSASATTPPRTSPSGWTGILDSEDLFYTPAI